MIGCWMNATPLCALLDGGVVIPSCVAVPAVPVAVNVTGLPLMPLPAAVAVRVFGPAVVASVQLPTVAMPLASVVGLAAVRSPLPGATANVTATPATGFPLASRTITDGGADCRPRRRRLGVHAVAGDGRGRAGRYRNRRRLRD